MVVKTEDWGFLQGTWEGLSSKVNNPKNLFCFAFFPGCWLSLVLSKVLKILDGYWFCFWGLLKEGYPGLQFEATVVKVEEIAFSFSALVTSAGSGVLYVRSS